MTKVTQESIPRADLNLLVILQVLLEEGSVSRAAERLFLTQSAVSKALGRLRDQFRDELFTRVGNTMVPSPRALELQKELGPIIRSVNELIAEREFEPRTAEGDIKMAMSEHVGVLLLPPLIQQLMREAPNIKLTALNRVDRQLDRLASGELDFALHMQRQNYPSEFRTQLLIAAPSRLVARKDHPLANRALNIYDVASLNVVRLIMPDENEVEFVSNFSDNERVNVDTNTRFETSHFSSALEVVASTDCVLPLAFFPGWQNYLKGFTWLDFQPFEKLYIRYYLVTHSRTDSSPLHQWLQRKILSASQFIASA
jgi:DNA-binding transcriptional LysR family regulator